ncbi:MAG: TIGR00730 family Rossman fold protein [Spirochaetales bacterium]|nr:TIGR00730 family Rossman fold protein [Spirochaetales bacterium]
MKIKNVCVFLGSSMGSNPIYQEAARSLGNYIAEQSWNLVYGGSSIGLMGILAKAALDKGAEVYGVIPQSLYDKVGHHSITKTFIVENMHERKMMMQNMSDCFIAMPGGLGTLEEIFESLTWLQLGFHQKPCAFFNINHYYDALFDFLDHSVNQGFIKDIHRNSLLEADSPETLFKKIKVFTPPLDEKWIRE